MFCSGHDWRKKEESTAKKAGKYHESRVKKKEERQKGEGVKVSQFSFLKRDNSPGYFLDWIRIQMVALLRARTDVPTDNFQHFVFWIVFLWLQFLTAYFWKNSVNKQLKASAVLFKSNTREFSRRCWIWFLAFYTYYIRYLC